MQVQPSGKEILNIKAWHERMADYFLAYPGAPLGDVARALGRTLPWVSIVYRSDMFQSYYAERRAMYEQDVLNPTISDKLDAIAHGSLDLMAERLVDPLERQRLAPRDVQGMAEMALESLGYGAPKVPGSQVVNNVLVVQAEDIAAGREILQNRTRLKLIEGGRAHDAGGNAVGFAGDTQTMEAAPRLPDHLAEDD